VSELHPANFQSDLCHQLTPATVCVWIRRRGVSAYERGDRTLAQMLGMAANTVEKLIAIELAARPADGKPV
jgi:hypothetical protein